MAALHHPPTLMILTYICDHWPLAALAAALCGLGIIALLSSWLGWRIRNHTVGAVLAAFAGAGWMALCEKLRREHTKPNLGPQLTHLDRSDIDGKATDDSDNDRDLDDTRRL